MGGMKIVIVVSLPFSIWETSLTIKALYPDSLDNGFFLSLAGVLSFHCSRLWLMELISGGKFGLTAQFATD